MFFVHVSGTDELYTDIRNTSNSAVYLLPSPPPQPEPRDRPLPPLPPAKKPAQRAMSQPPAGVAAAAHYMTMTDVGLQQGTSNSCVGSVRNIHQTMTDIRDILFHICATDRLEKLASLYLPLWSLPIYDSNRCLQCFGSYSTVALVPPMSTTDVWRGIT